MDEQVMTALSERGEALRYVTEHFQDLRGVGLAPFWAFVLASFLFGFDSRSSGRAVLTTIMAGVLVAVLSHLWARRWYRTRYGIVIKPTGARYTSPWQRVVAVLIFGLAIWTILFRLFDDNAVLAVVVISEPILVPRCFDTVCSSGTSLRRMLYSASLMAVIALSVWSLFGGLGGRSLMASMAGCCLLLSIYDHYLLDHILRPGTRTEENDCE